MFANFIEETCTGTTGILTLAGPTIARVAFSKAYADGDAVEYSVEDANGILKEVGTGIYNSTGNTITRSNPRTTWDGTTYKNVNASILTLTGGTHTVRCSVIADIPLNALLLVPSGRTIFSTNITSGGNNTEIVSIDTLYLMSFIIDKPVDVSDFKFRLAGAVASSKYVLGLYRVASDGTIGDLIFDTADLDGSSGGETTVALDQTYHLSPGEYMLGLVSDSLISFNSTSNRAAGKSVLGVSTQFASGWNGYTTQAHTFVADEGLPATPALGTASDGPENFLFGLVVA